MLFNKNFAALFAIFFLVLVWVVYIVNQDLFTLDNFFQQVEYIKNFIDKNFFLSFLIFIISYCCLVICNFPAASILSMIGGFLFSSWMGGIGIIIGGTLGSLIVFIMAKYFLLEYVKKIFLSKHPNVSKYFFKNELELMLLIRIIPGIPFFAQNLILAGLGPSNLKFFYTTLIGIAPWAFIFSSFGKGLEEIFIQKVEISIFLFLKLEYLGPLGLVFLLAIFIKVFKKKVRF